MTARLYIDGYNFFYSIDDPDRLYLGWCDFRKLAEKHFLQKGESLDTIKYFTAPVGKTAYYGEKDEQRIWLEAVATINNLETIKGYHQKPDTTKDREEKQTDVKIAVANASNLRGIEATSGVGSVTVTT